MSASGLQQLLYRTSQAARTSWFWSHYALASRLAVPDRSVPKQRLPTQRHVIADLRALYERDWQNIDDGLYGLPHDLVPRPYSGVRQTLRFFGDLAAVHRRRRAGANQEVFDGPYRNKRPRYYLQNFYNQSGGYLSEESANSTTIRLRYSFPAAQTPCAAKPCRRSPVSCARETSAAAASSTSPAAPGGS